MIRFVAEIVATAEMQSKRIKLIGNIPSESGFPERALFLRSTRRRIFLLSPANASGLRGNLLLKDAVQSPMADRLRNGGVPLGEIFTFISGLYFRGKLAYARAYADPPPGVPGVVVITASGGLVSPDRLFTLEELREIVAGRVDAAESRYRIPLERDARLLRDHGGDHCEIVLLGSVATSKYVEPLLGIFGERLMFPAEFVGRGDMSRGGLLLRSARDQVQLKYVPVAGAARNGARPAKLPKLKRSDVLIGPVETPGL
jgi:hypothetical protein